MYTSNICLVHLIQYCPIHDWIMSVSFFTLTKSSILIKISESQARNFGGGGNRGNYPTEGGKCNFFLSKREFCDLDGQNSNSSTCKIVKQKCIYFHNSSYILKNFACHRRECKSTLVFLLHQIKYGTYSLIKKLIVKDEFIFKIRTICLKFPRDFGSSISILCSFGQVLAPFPSLLILNTPRAKNGQVEPLMSHEYFLNYPDLIIPLTITVNKFKSRSQ